MKPQDSSQAPEPPGDEETRRWVIAIRRRFTPVFENVKPILWFLYSACALFVLLELVFLFGWADKGAHYGWENMVGYYAAYGFISCVLLVFAAKYLLRPLVMRDEDYYDKPPGKRD